MLLRLCILASTSWVASMVLAQVAARSPSSPSTGQGRKAEEAIKSGNLEAAERELRALLALDPDQVEARGKLASMTFLQGKWAEAARELREVLKRQPALSQAQAMLGMCEKRLGRPAEAQRLLEQSVPRLTEGPLRLQAGLDLVEIFYQAGELDRAAAAIGLLERTGQPSPDVLYAAWRIYTELAYRARDALAATAPDSARMRQLMAQHLIHQGDLGGGIAQYRRALEIDPKLPGVRYELGQAILLSSVSEDALQQAEKEFRLALVENPSDANAEYMLGRIYALRLDYNTALEHYQRALRLRPDHGDAHSGLGDALMKIGQPGKALDHLLEAVRINPLNLTARYRLATAYRQLGRDTEARKEWAAFQQLKKQERRIQEIYEQIRFRKVDEVPLDTSKQ
jgi:tetratricopeptide (TPR) repeat protein